ncbi:MAG: hypothetical protein P1S60_10780 [Anaerolineae bacterium]|nr:hypothetical protein [Anaerolineae bacterium]
MQHRLTYFKGFLTILSVVLMIVWIVTAMTNSDPLWFIPRFTAQAKNMTIYWDGITTTISENDPGYDAIMQAFAQAMAKPVAFEWEVGFSEENISLYKTSYKMLEVVFDEPVQVHTRYPYNKAKTYLVPLDKTHADYRRIFSYTGYVPYSSGPVNIHKTAFVDLYSAVEQAVGIRKTVTRSDD